MITGWQWRRLGRSMLLTAALWLPAAGAVATEYVCPMHPGVRDAAPGSCPKCSMPLEAVGEPATAFVCPMHPGVRSATPGSCPKCSMPLELVSTDPASAATRPQTRGATASRPIRPLAEVQLDPGRVQQLGVRSELVEERPVTFAVRTPARVEYDQGRMSEVSLRFPAWIGKLYVDRIGQEVAVGDRLFDVYSYELYIAQRELISAHELEHRGGVSQVDESRRRLRRLGISTRQIAVLERQQIEADYVPVHAEVGGVVIDKNVVVGAGVAPGQTLLRLAALDRVWIEAEVDFADLGLIDVGKAAEVVVGATTAPATVAYVYPFVAEGRPTGRVRLELDNPGGRLRPGMYADVRFQIDRGSRLVVPEAAVIYSGPRRLVLVDVGGGRFQPREIEIARKSGPLYEVTAGVAAGERVVVGAGFFIAAESRLRSALGTW